ncbi:MAG: hypothetical protein AAF501_07175 [Pseudomonadota bacterium]
MPLFKKKKKNSESEKIKTPKVVGQADTESKKTADAMEAQIQEVTKTIRHLKKIRKKVAIILMIGAVIKKTDNKAYKGLEGVYKAADRLVTDLSSGNADTNNWSKVSKSMKDGTKSMAKQKALGAKADACNILMRQSNVLHKKTDKVVGHLEKASKNLNVLETAINKAIKDLNDFKKTRPEFGKLIDKVISRLEMMKKEPAVKAGKKASTAVKKNGLGPAKKWKSMLSRSSSYLDTAHKNSGNGILT